MNNSIYDSTLENLLKRGKFSLEDWKFKDARSFFDQALNVDPESCAAYVGLAMAQARITHKDDFFWYCVEQHNKGNAVLERARQFADDDWKDFFNRVDIQVQKEEIEKEAHIKTTKKTIGLTVIGIVLIVAIILVMPLVVFSPAEQLYKSGQYEQAYEKAVQISSSGLGSMLSKGKIEKYAYAYLIDHLECNGNIEVQLSNSTILYVNSYGGKGVCFGYETTSNKYRLVWSCIIYQFSDDVSCCFMESEYTPTSSHSVYISHGKFNRDNYRDSKSIEHSISNGYPNYSSRSALYEQAEITISKALLQVENELGIPAKHLGFYAFG